jgi:hypothetical protein
MRIALLWCFMKWHFGHDGEWVARSKAKDGFVYRIQVCEDGTFDISKSDHGFTRRVDTFQRLHNAKTFCETEERVHLERTADPNDEVDEAMESAR